MTRGWPLMALAIVVLGSHLIGGCEATLTLPLEPPVRCLKVRYDPSQGRRRHATLWRGGSRFVGSHRGDATLDEQLIEATADNPAAAAEARAYHRTNEAIHTIEIVALPTSVGLFLSAYPVAFDANDHRAAAGLMAGAVLTGWGAIISSIILSETVGDRHLHRALSIYNNAAPPDCGWPAEDAASDGSP